MKDCWKKLLKRARRYIGIVGLCWALQTPALAQTSNILDLPASILYVKIDETGARVPGEYDRQAWSQFAMNLGGLIERIEPYRANQLIPDMPFPNGAGAAVMAARQAGHHAGYDYIIVYGSLPDADISLFENQGLEHAKQRKKLLPTLRQRLTFWTHDDDIDTYELVTPEQNAKRLRGNSSLVGEAHLLSVNGGPPLASAWASADKREIWKKPFSSDKRDQEITSDLVSGIQNQIYQLSYRNFSTSASIAD
jgi:hypothetical protein